MSDDGNFILFSGNSNLNLAKKICKNLKIPLGDALVSSFSDNETRVEICENIRGKDIFIVQSTSFPANQNVMEALIMIDACQRASAKTITLVVPYFGYARQDRKTASRSPIAAKMVAELFEVVGVNRVLSLELHNSAIQGFFRVPVDHLFAKSLFYEYFSRLNLKNLVIVSPDAGGVERSRALAKCFGCGLAIVDKRRNRPNESVVMHLIGEVRNKECLIVDDIVDTGGSLVRSAESLKNSGANRIFAAVTHPVLSGRATELIADSCLEQLVVTDSISLTKKAQDIDKIKQISASGLIAEAIRRINMKDSISSLFA